MYLKGHSAGQNDDQKHPPILGVPRLVGIDQLVIADAREQLFALSWTDKPMTHGFPRNKTFSGEVE